MDIKKIALGETPHYKYKFNKKRDRQASVAGLAVQIGEVMRSGRVPSKVGPDDSAYNYIENPGNIVGRPRDEFDAIRMQQQAVAAGTVKKDEPSGDPSPAPESSQE